MSQLPKAMLSQFGYLPYAYDIIPDLKHGLSFVNNVAPTWAMIIALKQNFVWNVIQ